MGQLAAYFENQESEINSSQDNFLSLSQLSHIASVWSDKPLNGYGLTLPDNIKNGEPLEKLIFIAEKTGLPILRLCSNAITLPSNVLKSFLDHYFKKRPSYLFANGSEFGLNDFFLELIDLKGLKTIKRQAIQLLPDNALNAFTLSNAHSYIWNLEEQRYFYTKAAPERFICPQGINIEPTSRCNLRCTMCYYDKDKIKVDIDMALFSSIIDQMAEFPRRCIGELCYRGEPLLNPHLSEMTDYMTKRNVPVGIVTNGILMTGDLVKKLLEAPFVYFYFSVDAATAETYEKIRVGASFEKLNRKIDTFLKIKTKNFSDHPVSIGIKCVVQNNNLEELEAIKNHWLPRVDMVVFQNQLVNTKTGFDLLGVENQIADIPKNRHSCHTLWRNLCIAADGNITSCAGGYLGKSTESLGNAKHNSLMSVWNSNRLREVQELTLANRFEEATLCKNCDGKGSDPILMRREMESPNVFVETYASMKLYRKLHDTV